MGFKKHIKKQMKLQDWQKKILEMTEQDKYKQLKIQSDELILKIEEMRKDLKECPSVIKRIKYLDAEKKLKLIQGCMDKIAMDLSNYEFYNLIYKS